MLLMQKLDRQWMFKWAAACALAAALAPTIVLARAGGGEGFSGDGGGGGGGGGFGGGDDGIGTLFYLLIQLAFRYPVIGVPVLVVVIVGYVMVQRRGVQAYKGSVIVRGSALVGASRIRPGIQALMNDDAQFQPPAFLERVRKAFLATQAAWAGQNLTPVRAFLSDGVYERFSIQLAEQKMLGHRNEMGNLRVLSTNIVQAEVDEVHQTVSVRIEAIAQDSYVSLSDGRRLSGGEAAEFGEIWTFLRKRGAQSKQNADGLIEGHCPNCGVAIEMNQHAKCRQCGSLLRSGEYDWVLVEITQSCEWRPEVAPVAGVAALRERDRTFAVAGLENTASVVFWRLMAAQRTGKADPIRKMATDDFCAKGVGVAGADGSRIFYSKCAVGSVRTMGVYTAQTWDRAVVEVIWSGLRCSIDPAGQVRQMGPNGASRLLLVLGRQVSAMPHVDVSISSAHCPNCGAPQEESTANDCESCRTVMNDGKQSWVLLEATAALSAAGQQILSRLQDELPSPADAGEPAAGLSRPGNAGTLAWLVQSSTTDGQICPDEQKMLKASAKKWGVPDDRVTQMLQAAATGDLQPPQPRDRDEARRWLTEMTRISLADGNIAKGEYRLMQTAGQSCGLVAYDLKAIITQTRAQLYTESRAALREARRAAKAVA